MSFGCILLYLLVLPLTFAEIELPESESCRQTLGQTSVKVFFDNFSGRCFYFAYKDFNMGMIKKSVCRGDENCCGKGRHAYIDNAHVFHNIFLDFSQEQHMGYNGWSSYESFWVGLDRLDSGHNYEFTGKKENIDNYYTAWNSGEPDGDTDKCAAGYNKGIESLPCSKKKMYLCEYQYTNTGCPLGFFQSLTTNKCYMIRDDRIAIFQRARRWCYDHGADMFTVNSQQEKEVLTNFDFGTLFWIGLTDIALEDHFFWVNGHRLAWNDWKTGEPSNSNGDENCVNMNDGRNDYKCEGHRHYVCQRPKFRASENGGCPGDSWRYVETGRCYIIYYTVYKDKSGASDFCKSKEGVLASKPAGLESRFDRLIASFITDVWFDGATYADNKNGRPLCEFTPPQSDCDSGYFYHQYLDTCYRIVNTQTKTWNDARADCQNVTGGDLIQVTDKTVHDFVVISITESTWLGAKRQTPSDLNSFIWTKHNTPLSDTDGFWGINEPNNYNGDVEDCLEIAGAKHIFHQWNDLPCNRLRHYICEHSL